MADLWDTFKDRWEWDSSFRGQIILAVAVGTIGLVFAWAEAYGKVRIQNA